MRLVLVSLLALSCSAGAEVRVVAAASLTDALSEIAAAYERKSGERVMVSFGASSILARQIAAGAPADLFISADEATMRSLVERQLVLDDTRVSLLSNRLAVVTAADASMTVAGPRDLLSLDSIALAEPSSVPAGVYARQYLHSAGVWEALADQVIPTENVRAALFAVEAGNADAAIVYETDARLSQRVRIAFVVQDGPRISYPAAVVAGGENTAAARRFLTHLQSAEAAAVFRRHGFLVNV